MADQLDDLLKDIALKHGVALGRDDPILILRTMNAHLFDEGTRAQQEMMTRLKEDLEDLALRWDKDSKARAEKMLNVALTASKEAMAKLAQETARTAAVTVKNEVDAALARVTNSIRQARAIATMNLVASLLTIIAAAAVVWVR